MVRSDTFFVAISSFTSDPTLIEVSGAVIVTVHSGGSTCATSTEVMWASPSKETDNISPDKNRMNSPSLFFRGSLQRRSTADKKYVFEIQVPVLGYLISY